MDADQVGLLPNRGQPVGTEPSSVVKLDGPSVKGPALGGKAVYPDGSGWKGRGPREASSTHAD